MVLGIISGIQTVHTVMRMVGWAHGLLRTYFSYLPISQRKGRASPSFCNKLKSHVVFVDIEGLEGFATVDGKVISALGWVFANGTFTVASLKHLKFLT